MNKILLTSLLALCIITGVACTKKTQPKDITSEQEPKQTQNYQHEKLPQSVFDGIPFPATKEQAKSVGLTNCVANGEKQYSCSLSRKLKFEGYEFESAYVVLNTANNLVDFGTSVELGYSDLRPFESSMSSNEYTYRTIHLTTKLEVDPACARNYAQEVKLAHSIFEVKANNECSTGDLFLKELEVKGWLKKCDEGHPSTNECGYYSKNGSYRIINHHDSRGVTLTHEGLILRSLNLEVEPLPPSEYGAYFKEVGKQQQLESQIKTKEQGFIKSMKN